MKLKRFLLVSMLAFVLVMFTFPGVLSADVVCDDDVVFDVIPDPCNLQTYNYDTSTFIPPGGVVIGVNVEWVYRGESGNSWAVSNGVPFGGPGDQAFTTTLLGNTTGNVAEVGLARADTIRIYYNLLPSISIDSVDTSECEKATISVTVNCCEEGQGWTLSVDGPEDKSTNGTAPSDSWNGGHTFDLLPGVYTATFASCCTEVESEPFTVAECPQPTPRSFTITATTDSHGTITDEGASSVAKGSSKGYSMDTVSTDCHIIDILIDGASIGKQTDYEFTHVNANHTIHVVTVCDAPKPEEPEETVEVLGIQEELPFTGQSTIIYIIGAAMLFIAAGLAFVLKAVKSRE